MTIRDMLVLTDATDASLARSELAVQLAKRFDAHLTGVFPRQTEAVLYAAASVEYAPLILSQGMIEAFNAAVDAAARKSQQSFRTAAAGYVAPDWQAVNGDSASAMVARMCRTDLTILSPRPEGPATESGIEPALLSIRSGGPQLVVPDGVGAGAPLGRHVLVAWNGRREPARALREALPLIAEADRVTVLTVDHDHGAEGGDDLKRYLALHGIKADLRVERDDDASAGDVMLRLVQQEAYDLIVMGLYGHTRLREFILGGASRAMLTHSPVPLFVAH